MRPTALVLLAVVLGACGGTAPAPARKPFTKKSGEFTGQYSAEGRLQRLEQDVNGDGRPETVILYHPDGKMQYAEMDTDRDGTLDRWEYFGADGVLQRIATARRTKGKADTWDVVDPGGTRVVSREYDDDGDGRADRKEAVGAPPSPGSPRP